MDPATVLPTGEFVENGLPPEAMARLTEFELGEPDINKFVALTRARRRAASLGEMTRGDLDQSLRQRELRSPLGFEDELRVALCDAAGCWGALTLLREAKRPHFSAAEVRYLASLSAVLAEGLRRATLFEAVHGGRDDATGLLVLAPGDAEVETANAAGHRWLETMTTSSPTEQHLPVIVRAVATRARHTVGQPEAANSARARARTLAGEWFVVRGSLLGNDADARVAILIEPAHPPELAPLIADLYGLTQRERAVTELVAQGFTTGEIAKRLHLSAYTVQDHLKAIFEKTGTGSRRELVARLFFDSYLPRLTEPH
jgi:DNA-binding NarL/FixJ family response regulator